MAQVLYATNRFAGDGVTTTFSISFQGGYISKDHVKAFITDANGVRTDITLTAGMWVGPFTLDIGQVVPVGSTLTIKRETPKWGPLVDYTNGTRITERNLDTANQQAVFIGAEAHDLFDVSGVDEAIGAAASVALNAASEAESAASSAASSAAAAASSAVSAAGSVSAAAVQASLAAAQVGLAATQVGLAQDQASDSASSAAASAASATSALAAKEATEVLAAAIEVAGVGFSAGAYDFGTITDPSTYFDRDFGTLP